MAKNGNCSTDTISITLFPSRAGTTYAFCKMNASLSRIAVSRENGRGISAVIKTKIQLQPEVKFPVSWFSVGLTRFCQVLLSSQIAAATKEREGEREGIKSELKIWKKKVDNRKKKWSDRDEIDMMSTPRFPSDAISESKTT